MMGSMDFKMLKLIKKWFSALFFNVMKDEEEFDAIPMIPSRKRVRKRRIKIIEPETKET